MDVTRSKFDKATATLGETMGFGFVVAIGTTNNGLRGMCSAANPRRGTHGEHVQITRTLLRDARKKLDDEYDKDGNPI